MREHQLINPLTNEHWNNLLSETPGYSFFHTSHWADVLTKTYQYTPFYLGRIVNRAFDSLLPLVEVDSFLTGKRGVCLPFTDVCHPLAQSEQDFNALFKRAVQIGKQRRWKYLEIRGGEKYLSSQTPSRHFQEHTLNLGPGQQQLFANLRESTKRNIKKAQKENLTVSFSSSEDAIRDFYRLNIITRREHGLPPQPYMFFNNLRQKVLAKGLGFIVSASTREETIAANLYLKFGKELIYKYGASDKRYQHLRANNLIMWEAIKWGVEHGMDKLSFGRTEPENTGLLQFKDGWGAESYQINYYRFDLMQDCFIAESSGINPLFNKIFSRLPATILEKMGNMLYRHMG